MSLSVSKMLGRTMHLNNFCFYQVNGFGRDGYIAYNNGGFWKDNEMKIKLKPRYPHHSMIRFYSLGRYPPPVKYFNDGTGRDTYISVDSGGLIKDENIRASFSPLSGSLRNLGEQNNICSSTQYQKPFISKDQRKINELLSKIQKNVVKRLYKDEKRKFLPQLAIKDNKGYYNPLLRSGSCSDLSRTGFNGFFSPVNNPNFPIKTPANIKYTNRLKIFLNPRPRKIIPGSNLNKNINNSQEEKNNESSFNNNNSNNNDIN